jgi:multiple sugar transport system permease protein
LDVPTLTVPFGTWVMIGSIAGIPKNLDEATLIDGARYIQMLIKISYAVAPAGIIAATIFCSTVSWASFLYGGFTTSADRLTPPVVIVTTLIGGHLHGWRQIMTGALPGAAAPLIIYAFLMDSYLAGLTAGAMKG